MAVVSTDIKEKNMRAHLLHPPYCFVVIVPADLTELVVVLPSLEKEE
jgi:hypothetical protein